MTTQPMPLEETIFGLNEMLRYDSAQKWPFRLNDEDRASIASALHHLEAGKESAAFLEWLLANCKIIHWPGGGHYPIEHAPAANKDSVMFLKMAMNKQGMYAGPPTAPTTEPQG